MELSYTLRICFGSFFILVKVFVCKSDTPSGMCWYKYQQEIEGNKDQVNVLYVCTSNQMSNETDTVYMDLAKTPLHDNSTCYCKVTFTNENMGVNHVNLDYKIESFTDVLAVIGDGDVRFSTNNKVHAVGTKLKDYYITFTLTSPKSALESCLRITSIQNKSMFRVQCFNNQFTPVEDTSSSENTWEITTSPSSGESTIETGHGSTSPLVKGTDIGSDNNNPSGAIIGGAAGGGAVLVIIIVIVIVVLVIKRKKTKATKANNEDFYMTENELYNVRNSSIKSTNGNAYDTYDAIETANETRDSRNYTEVDNNKNKPNANTKQPYTVNENEYNHLNDLKVPVSTGNIYSSIGKRGSDPGSNIYNTTHQSTHGNSNSGCKDDQVYNTSDDL